MQRRNYSSLGASAPQQESLHFKRRTAAFAAALAIGALVYIFALQTPNNLQQASLRVTTITSAPGVRTNTRNSAKATVNRVPTVGPRAGAASGEQVLRERSVRNSLPNAALSESTTTEYDEDTVYEAASESQSPLWLAGLAGSFATLGAAFATLFLTKSNDTPEAQPLNLGDRVKTAAVGAAAAAAMAGQPAFATTLEDFQPTILPENAVTLNYNAEEIAEIASDNRVGALALLFVPAVGWVAFNIAGPALNQISNMADKASENDSTPKKGRGRGTSRRGIIGMVGGGALLSQVAPDPAEAAYGDAANVFGKATNASGFVPYAGDGYALLLPSKWNPSKEQDFPGVELRYEDNFDAVNNLVVVVNKTNKTSISDFGPPEKFLESVSYLLGKQSYSGQTRSEGGFAENRVSAASLLGVEKATDKKGKEYYRFNILTRTADGDEGGRHQLISATCSSGLLYVLKVQVGDKRWFKGAKVEAEGAVNSFIVA